MKKAKQKYRYSRYDENDEKIYERSFASKDESHSALCELFKGALPVGAVQSLMDSGRMLLLENGDCHTLTFKKVS